MRYRHATRCDAPEIAALHAESWRTHYRGAYRDDYLDGDVLVDRRTVWQQRLESPPRNQVVVVAEEEARLAGFACAYGGQDPEWGTLLDNLHVRPGRQGRGVGARLVAELVQWCRVHYGGCGLYLWVLAENRAAQRFYERLGAVDRGGEHSVPPGGGRIHGRRYAWRSLAEVRTC